MAEFADLWKPKRTMRDWGRTEYRVVPNWTPRDVREARPSAPLPHLSSAAASLTTKSLRKQAPPLLQHTSPDQHSRPSGTAENEEEEEEGMVANEQGYPPQLASNAGDTDTSSQDSGTGRLSSPGIPIAPAIPSLLSLQQITSKLSSVRDSVREDGPSSEPSENRATSQSDNDDEGGDHSTREISSGNSDIDRYTSSDGEVGIGDGKSTSLGEGDSRRTVTKTSVPSRVGRNTGQVSGAVTNTRQAARLGTPHSYESGGEGGTETPGSEEEGEEEETQTASGGEIEQRGNRSKPGNGGSVESRATRRSKGRPPLSADSDAHGSTQPGSTPVETCGVSGRGRGGGRKRESVSGAPVKVKLWRPKHVTRSRKHLSELDVCLTACEQAVRDALDRAESLPVQRAVVKYWRVVQKHILSSVRQSHTVSALDTRLKKEQLRHKKLQRDMLTVFSSLRKCNGKYHRALVRARAAKDAEEPTAADSTEVETLSQYLQPFFDKYHVP